MWRESAWGTHPSKRRVEKGDKLSFLEIFPRNVFCALPLPCLRGLKSLMSATTAALHPFPVVTNLLLTGKSFSEGFFGDLHRQLLFRSPLLPFSTAHSSQKTARAGFYTRRVPPPSLCQAGTRLLHTGFTHWLPSSFARSSTPLGLRKIKNPQQHRPFRCKPAPRAPLATRTPP